VVIDARSADAAALGGGARAFGREREVGRDVDLDHVELPLRVRDQVDAEEVVAARAAEGHLGGVAACEDSAWAG
jgi:hypothetical protein